MNIYTLSMTWGHYVPTTVNDVTRHIKLPSYYLKRTVLNTHLLLVLMACLYCMRKGIMSKLFDILEFITNLPVKVCPEYRTFASTKGTLQNWG